MGVDTAKAALIRDPNLAVAVPLVVVAAVCQGEELEERQGLVPAVGLPVAWVLGLGS